MATNPTYEDPVSIDRAEHVPLSPSPTLLGLAVLGLLTGCKDDTAAGLVTSRKTVTSFDEAAFAVECADAGGVIQTHPHCGGVNSCKGKSYDRTVMELIEHTCKGANTCAGVSCVELPEDEKQEGSVTFAADCASCHDANSKFRLFVSPGADGTAESDRFETASEDALVESVAFGVPRRDAETSYPDMPATYERLSRGEIVRAIAFARSLGVTVDDSGEDPRLR